MGNIGAAREHYEVLPVGPLTVPESAERARAADAGRSGPPRLPRRQDEPPRDGDAR
jgi:hypothetical protein